jgi:hypothetical protein
MGDFHEDDLSHSQEYVLQISLVQVFDGIRDRCELPNTAEKVNTTRVTGDADLAKCAIAMHTSSASAPTEDFSAKLAPYHHPVAAGDPDMYLPSAFPDTITQSQRGLVRRRRPCILVTAYGGGECASEGTFCDQITPIFAAFTSQAYDCGQRHSLH